MQKQHALDLIQAAPSKIALDTLAIEIAAAGLAGDAEIAAAIQTAENLFVIKGSAPVPTPIAPVPVSSATPSVRVTPFGQQLWMSNFPDVTTKSIKGTTTITGLLNTIRNIEYLVSQYGIVCKYNAMTRKKEIAIPGMACAADTCAESTLTMIYDCAIRNGFKMTRDLLANYLEAICSQNEYHPARDWVESKKWDGVPRLADFFRTLRVGAGEEALRDICLRRWMTSAVAALWPTDDEAKFELCLVLQGAQGMGKTTWLRSLCDVPGSVLDGVTHFDAGNKDQVLKVAGRWLVEFGELESTFSKVEIGRTKAYLSNTHDTLRKAYGREEMTLRRQTVFAGSVNRPDFLIDETGNRRWLTIAVTSIERHSFDMQQVWAEVLAAYRAGERWYLSRDEDAMLSTSNERFEAVSGIAEQLHEAFEPAPPAQAGLPGVARDAAQRGELFHITPSQLLTIFHMPVDRKNMSEAGAALRKLTGAEPVSRNGVKGWKVLLRKDSRFAELARETARAY